MARYRGPKSRIARKFAEPIFGPDKVLDRKSYPPGQHGPNKRRAKKSEYSVQLNEKQKAKYTYGILERQFANLFNKASSLSSFTRLCLHQEQPLVTEFKIDSLGVLKYYLAPKISDE